MQTLALVLAALAVILSLFAVLRAKAAQLAAEDGARDARRAAHSAGEEAAAALDKQRQLLAAFVQGREITPDMVLEGRLWRDVDAPEGERMLASVGEVLVIDVRTAEEIATGALPGAVHIPVNELPERVAEIPREADQILVYCAGGARSADACEYLANEGYTGLANLAGGFSSWTGPVERTSG